MLSYRHAFHAGNHADVLKHVTQSLILEALCLKEKAVQYVDTHAGAGMYALDSGYAVQSGEAEQGIGRLWQRTDAPIVLKPYLDLLRQLNPNGTLRYYPGSPYFAWALLRRHDTVRLHELHPTDADLLRGNLRRWKRSDSLGAPSSMALQQNDGFASLKAHLPPVSRRGMVMIDPPYENKHDYEQVLLAVDEGLKRFATGVFMIWQPLVARSEAHHLLRKLPLASANSGLCATLTVGKSMLAQKALLSSAVTVLNPPWKLKEQLQTALPYLKNVMARDETASFTLQEWQA